MGNAIIGFKIPSDHPLDYIYINNRRSHLQKDFEATIRPITKTAPANSLYVYKVCYTTAPGQAASRDLFRDSVQVRRYVGS